MPSAFPSNYLESSKLNKYNDYFAIALRNIPITVLHTASSYTAEDRAKELKILLLTLFFERIKRNSTA